MSSWQPESAVGATVASQSDPKATVDKTTDIPAIPTWPPPAVPIENATTNPYLQAASTAGQTTVGTAVFNRGIGNPKSRLMERKMPGSGGAADSTYVLRIHEMLEDAEKEGNQDIVSWQPHGRAFRIHKEQEFVENVMPRYFKAKIGSFRRWLRAWGFVRMTEGKDRGAWYHRWFIRGVTNLCKNLTRLQMLEAMENWLPSGQIPDFYAASTGSLFSENPVAAVASVYHHQEANKELAKNPKRLRGTVLEDLRQLLEEAAGNEKEKHIISWLPHGKAFKIYQRDAFVKVIMPRFFKTAKLSHLSDTLRIWGFRRLKMAGKDKGAFFHINFVRGDASLTRHLSRQQMKEAMASWPGPDGEPDLYTAPPPQPPQQSMTLSPVAVIASGQAIVTVANAAVAAAAVLPAGASTDPINFLGLPADHTSAYPAQPVHQVMAQAQAVNDIDYNGAVMAPTAGNAINDIPDRNYKTNDGTYVLRIHEMLEDAEKMGNQSIVSWQPHGRAFRIHKEAEFESKIMPRYFKAKIASFRRWLRAWGFHRMTEGKDRGAWYHRYFVRGVTNLCRNLSRLQMLKAMQNWLPVGQVPDFYSGALSAQIQIPQHSANKNPKRLRGTVLEDLRRMLEDAQMDNSTSVSWLSHGRAFKITKKEQFTQSVLPRYFKAKKFTYFSDVLRIWGFVRLKGKEHKGAYYHRFFVRGRPELSRHLSRKEMKESMKDWPPSNVEPDLHSPDADRLVDRSFSATSTSITAVAAPPIADFQHAAGTTILATAETINPSIEAAASASVNEDTTSSKEKCKRSEFVAQHSVEV